MSSSTAAKAAARWALMAATSTIGSPAATTVVAGSDGAIVPAHTMRVTVSCDHRIIDGVMAGRFLEELKALLERPLGLVVA